MHLLRNIRALYSVFLSIEGETVTFQFNCSLANNCCKDSNLSAPLRKRLSYEGQTHKYVNYFTIYLLEGAENSRNKVNILLYELTNANSTSKLSTF